MTGSLRHSVHWPRGPFWTYFVGGALYVSGFSAYFFLLNLYLMEHGANEQRLGLYGTLLSVGGVVGTFPTGLLARRFGIRTVLCIAVPLACGIAALRVANPNPGAQLILAPLEGWAMCTWAVCMAPLVAALTSERERSTGFSVIFCSGIGFAGLGGWLAGIAPHLLEGNSKAAVMLIGCAVATSTTLPLMCLPRNVKSTKSGRTRPFFHPALRRLIFPLAIWALVTGSFPVFANVFFVRHLGMSLPRLGVIHSASQLLQAAAILIAPFVFRSVSRTRSIAITQVGTAIGIGTIGVCNAHYAAPVFCIYMAVQYMNEPALYSFLMDAVPSSERTSASSSASFISSSAQALAPLVMGALIVRWGYSIVLSCLGVLAFCAALAFWSLGRARSQEISADSGTSKELSPLCNF